MPSSLWHYQLVRRLMLDIFHISPCPFCFRRGESVSEMDGERETDTYNLL